MTTSCQEIQELLPWIATQTASPAERRQVFAHIAVCATCRRELVEVVALARRVESATEALPGPARAVDHLALLEAAGLPPLVVELVRGARSLVREGVPVSLGLPWVAPLTVHV